MKTELYDITLTKEALKKLQELQRFFNAGSYSQTICLLADIFLEKKKKKVV